MANGASDLLVEVFGDKGKLIELPDGFMGFQSQDVMGDQRLVEEPGKGLRLMGSLPPGEVTLLWGFDLPVEGSEASFSLAVPWTAFAYRVVADAAPGMGANNHAANAAGIFEPAGNGDRLGLPLGQGEFAVMGVLRSF